MPEGRQADNIINSLVELAESASKQKSVSFFEEERSNSVTSKFNRLFGRQKPVHHLLGGGRSADVLLWRNKKISASVLTGATAIWILFEWLNYHFLSLLFFSLFFGMLVQFIWANALCLLKRSPSQIPPLVLPNELFANAGMSVGVEVNQVLRFLQDVSRGGNLKQFLVVIASLWAAAMIGSWCNFLTVVYIGFIAAHTLPVLYERYEDEIDGFLYKVFDQLRSRYRRLDAGVLRRLPKGKLRWKKYL